MSCDVLDLISRTEGLANTVEGQVAYGIKQLEEFKKQCTGSADEWLDYDEAVYTLLMKIKDAELKLREIIWTE